MATRKAENAAAFYQLKPETQDWLQDFLEPVDDYDQRTIDVAALEEHPRKDMKTHSVLPWDGGLYPHLTPPKTVKQQAKELGVSPRTVKRRRRAVEKRASEPVFRFTYWPIERTEDGKLSVRWAEGPQWHWKRFGPPRRAKHWREALPPEVRKDLEQNARGCVVYVPKRRGGG